jgi:cyanate permease
MNRTLTRHSEGIITVGVAIVSKWLIPDWPETAKFLTEDERRLLIARLSADVADAKMNRLDGPARKRVFGDWKIYCGVVMYIGIVNTGYATSFFTPTIIRDLGFTAEAAQIRSIPVFVVATIVSLVIAWCADRARHRFGFCILGICMASVGYIILLCQDSVSVGVRYFAIFIIVSGGYICQPVTLAWIQNNMTGHYKRSIASAMMVGFGNCGGIVASNIFITGEAPRYTTGYATSLGLLWMCAAACVVLLFGVRAENKKRDRGERDWRLDTPDADNLGDDHPHFRFTY